MKDYRSFHHVIDAICTLLLFDARKKMEIATQGEIVMPRRVDKVMKPLMEEEGDIEIDIVKRVLTNRSGLNFGTF